MLSLHRSSTSVDQDAISECLSSEMKCTASSGQAPNGVKKQYENIQKSPNDTRFYRGLILDNEMKVLLISDPTTDKSAASMEVQVGFMSDPPELPGLAHFCEHMLFLGSEKYPSPNEYNAFLSQHGGSSNASTHTDHTNFYFSVIPEQFGGALDRFSQFFLGPLFTECSTESELNAVHSEYEKNIAIDAWRANMLERFTADPNHDFSKFGAGNRETLETVPKEKGINVRDALLNFHQTWYSSNIMSLSVFGKESLDELEKMTVDLFSQVKNRKVEAPTWPEHPYNEEHFAKKWYVVPIKDMRCLTMIFPLPDLQEHFRSAPCYYVSHLLGHESDGTLLSVLKKLGWSDSLMAGERTMARGGCNFFILIVGLTEEGLNHVDDIITLFFQYVNMLKKEGPLQWIFDEYKQISKMDFDFKEKTMPEKYVVSTVRALHKFPMEEVLVAPCIFPEWRPDLINLVTDHLTPEKLRIYIVSKSFEEIATESEPWYGTKFKMEEIPEELLEKWRCCGLNPELVLPAKNEFIPEDFAIRSIDKPEVAEKFPVIIEDSPLMRVWFKQDDEFLLPRVHITFEFASPIVYLDPINSNLTYMYTQLVKDSLNEYAYSASLAGLSWSFNNSEYGITLAIRGYHDKHRTLLEKIMDKMVNFTIDEKRFKIIHERHVRGLKNLDTDSPYKHAIYYLAVLLADRVWNRDDLLEACSHVTVERLRDFVPQMLERLHVQSLVHGNLSKAEALETVHLVESKLKESARNNNGRVLLPLLPRQLLLNREIRLDDGCNFLYEAENIHHKSSCTQVYYQTVVRFTESNMHLELLAQIISEPCFTVLRTQERLGYIVHCGIHGRNGIQGLRVIVQSDRHPSFVKSRIELFIESIHDLLTNMSDEEFNRHKVSLAAQRLEKPKKMGILSEIFWGEIISQQYNFDRTNIEVAYLMTLTKDQILQFYKEFIWEKSPIRRKLVVYVVSKAEGGAELEESTGEKSEEQLASVPVEIKDIIAFKASQSLSPLLPLFNAIPGKSQKSKL